MRTLHQSNKTEVSDEKLMESYQLGDYSSFEELYRRHSGKVYGYLVKSLRDRVLADDIFQATFMKLHAFRAKYDPTLPFVPWLFTVCRSVMIDSIRSKKAVQEETNSEAVELAACPSTPETMSETIMNSHEIPDLKILPQNQQKAIELRFSDELTFEEISKRLNVSPANARQLVSRALKRLKSLKNSPKRSY